MSVREFRDAVRRLMARPGYALLSVAVLALGLGAVLFMFSVLDHLVLRPLPFPNADRLVAIGHARDGAGNVGYLRSRDLAQITETLRGVDAYGIWTETTVAIGRGGPFAARQYQSSAMSAEVLPLLGVRPALGRAFSEADDRPGAELTLLLSDTVWREDFGADPAVLGQRLTVNGEPATVIGVMPPGFAFPYVDRVWLPRRFAADDGVASQVMARLAPGMTLSKLRLELEVLAERLGDQLEGARDHRRLRVVPIAERFVDSGTRQYLWLMFATGVLVLLLACINAANLQWMQAVSRRREIAVRAALGASRIGLLRELLIESLLLSLAATVLALLLAHLGVEWLLAVLTASGDSPPYFAELGVDLRLVGFALLAALLATALAGMAPAMRSSRVDVQRTLRDGDKGSGGGFARLARSMVLVEVALTVVLLVGAGTFVRGLVQVLAFDFGTRADPASILTARIGPVSSSFASGAEQVRFLERVIDRLRGDPQILAASVSTALPGTMGDGHELVAAEGNASDARSAVQAQHARVDDGFLDTYGIRLVSGRGFDGRDQADSEPVVIVDRRLAERVWPGSDPIGQYLLLNPQRERHERRMVVGVTDPLHLEDADDPVLPILLVPLRQAPARFASIAVRTGGDVSQHASLIAAAVLAEDADTLVHSIQTQAEAIRSGRIGPVVLTQMFVALGAVALLLAAVGLYGVLGFVVLQRQREIGIRRAIGAGHGSIVQDVGARLAFQVCIGICVGLLLALPWSKLLEDPQLQTRGFDPLVFAIVIIMTVAVAIVACYAPLRRALHTDPMVALRHD